MSRRRKAASPTTNRYEGIMNFTAWHIILIVIGSLYAILIAIWGVIMWRNRPWSLNLVMQPKGCSEISRDHAKTPSRI
jgi:cytochrome b subunit of formate dehydrogenase